MANDHRLTPEEVLAPVKANYVLTLDPCSNRFSIVNAHTNYILSNGQDGLRLSWHTEDVNVSWVNCPWSDIMPWALKAKHEYSSAPEDIEILFWVPCYPETQWFKVLWSVCSRVCFWHKRVNHPDPYFVPTKDKKKDTGTKWPNALVYIGSNPEKFERVFKNYGQIVIPIR